MKHLIIYADPNKDTISREILQQCLTTLQESGADVLVRNLGQKPVEAICNGASPITDPDYQKKMDEVLLAQKEVMDADKITFICGVWKGSLSKNLKTYVDQVFTQEFAFNLIAGGKDGVTCKKKFGMISIELIPDNQEEEEEFNSNHHDVEYKDVIERSGSPLEFHLSFQEYKADQEKERQEILDQVGRTMHKFIESPSCSYRGDWDINI